MLRCVLICWFISVLIHVLFLYRSLTSQLLPKFSLHSNQPNSLFLYTFWEHSKGEMNGKIAHWNDTTMTLNSKHLNDQNETGFLDPRPRFLGFQMSGLVTYSYTPNKESWWRTEEEVSLQGLGLHLERDRVGTQPFFSHLQGTDMRFSFKWTEFETGDERYVLLNGPNYRHVTVIEWGLIDH
jgi:hypothetical protein